MKVRVPPVAPGVEPVQGASKYLIPLAANFWLMARLADGEMVLQSATTVPGFAPAITPLTPTNTSSAMAVSPTQTKTHSDFSPTCLGESQAVAFSSCASCFALLAVCDHTATSCPARARLRAMG